MKYKACTQQESLGSEANASRCAQYNISFVCDVTTQNEIEEFDNQVRKCKCNKKDFYDPAEVVVIIPGAKYLTAEFHGAKFQRAFQAVPGVINCPHFRSELNHLEFQHSQEMRS